MLLFGLVTVPRVFRKVLSVVAAHFHYQGSSVFPYFDDWLLIGRSHQEVLTTTSSLLSLLHLLGFCINSEKSVLVPVQTVEFIGATLDSLSAKAYLPQGRVQSTKDLVSQYS